MIRIIINKALAIRGESLQCDRCRVSFFVTPYIDPKSIAAVSLAVDRILVGDRRCVFPCLPAVTVSELFDLDTFA